MAKGSMQAASPATCMSEYGVLLGEEAVPFVIATDLGDSASEGTLTSEEAAVVGLALHRSIVGRSSGQLVNVRSLWADRARLESVRQRY